MATTLFDNLIVAKVLFGFPILETLENIYGFANENQGQKKRHGIWLSILCLVLDITLFGILFTPKDETRVLLAIIFQVPASITTMYRERFKASDIIQDHPKYTLSFQISVACQAISAVIQLGGFRFPKLFTVGYIIARLGVGLGWYITYNCHLFHYNALAGQHREFFILSAAPFVASSTSLAGLVIGFLLLEDGGHFTIVFNGLELCTFSILNSMSRMPFWFAGIVFIVKEVAEIIT